MKFPELTDWSSSSSLLQVKCLQKDRFLEATWFLINFFRMVPGPYLGSLAIFEVRIKFCVSQDWL